MNLSYVLLFIHNYGMLIVSDLSKIILWFVLLFIEKNDISTFMNIDVLDSSSDESDSFEDPVDYSALQSLSVDRIIRKRVSKEVKITSVIFKVQLVVKWSRDLSVAKYYNKHAKE